MKEVSKKTILCYCLPQFAVGLFTTMLNNYLIYFYQPTKSSGLPTLITQGYVIAGVLTVIGLIKALGHVIDAVSDPVVASISDKFDLLGFCSHRCDLTADPCFYDPRKRLCFFCTADHKIKCFFKACIF